MTNHKTHTIDWVLATDLDGTLLDRQYDLSAAASAINSVLDQHSWVSHCILATSKTLAELEPLATLCNTPPVLIFENGTGYANPATPAEGAQASTAVSAYQSEVVGAPYATIRQTLNKLRDQHGFDFQGFGDMAVTELCAMTALNPAGAALAKARAASEPLVWRDTSERLIAFQHELEGQDLQLIRGGQFYHVSSPQTDKAEALRAWKQVHAATTRLLACGDAPNDRQMLLMADRAIVFPGGEHGPLLPSTTTVSNANSAGPSGWFDAVTRVLDAI